MRRKIAILILGVLLWYGGLAQAVPITIGITGNVTSASGSGLPSTIHDGVSFSGTYTYNSATTDSDTDPQRGVYIHDDPYVLVQRELDKSTSPLRDYPAFGRKVF